MNYYFLETYDRTDNDFCFISRPPAEIHLLSSYISGGKVAVLKYPQNVQAKMCDKRGGRVLSDFIGNSELSIIASAAAKAVIAQVNQGETEYLPVSILNHKQRVAATDYFYVNPIGTFDCLDYTLSDIDYCNETGGVIGVDRFVLCPNKLQTMPDLFRIKEAHREYVISQRLLEALRAANLTNINVIPLEQTGALHR